MLNPPAGAPVRQTGPGASARDAPRLTALFLPDLEFGGVERVTLNLASALLERGHRVDLVLARAGGDMLGEAPGRARVVDLGCRRVLRSVPRLARYLRREKPRSLVLVNNHAILAGLWAVRLSGARTRTLVVDHGVLSHEAATARTMKLRAIPLLMRVFARWADTLASVSQASRADFARTIGIRAERIKVLYNPTITPAFFQAVRARVEHPWLAHKTQPVVLAAGRLAPPKDFHALVRAFGVLRERIAARLIILGEGQDRASLESLVRHLRLEDDVALPGYSPQVPACMAAADAFALSSRWENLSCVVIEALAAGTQVVATDCPGGIREILGDGVFGELVPVGDHPALAGALYRAITGPRRPAGQDAWQRFTLEATVDAYESVL